MGHGSVPCRPLFSLVQASSKFSLGGSSVGPLACCVQKTVGRLTYLLVGREDTDFMVSHGCITAHWQLKLETDPVYAKHLNG